MWTGGPATICCVDWPVKSMNSSGLPYLPFHSWSLPPQAESEEYRSLGLGVSHTLRGEEPGQDCLQVRALRANWRPPVELTILWSSGNEHKLASLVDTGAECTPIHGTCYSPDVFWSPWYRWWLWEKAAMVRKVLWYCKLGVVPLEIIRLLSLQYQRTYQGWIFYKVKFCKPLSVKSA